MNDDLDAIRRVLAADVESFRRLVERYQRPLLTLIRNLTPPDTDHEGVGQEVFLAAFRSLASFDPKRSAFSTWLFTIARNRCRNELARRRPVVDTLLPDVVDLRSPVRAASETEGEGAGRDVFRAGRQPEQFARQPHDRLRGPWRRARRRTVQVLASRDLEPVRRPDRISTTGCRIAARMTRDSHRTTRIELQISTNFTGSSGEKAMLLKRPRLFDSKTWRHKSQKSSFIPQVRPFRPLKTEGRTSMARISPTGTTTV